MPGSDRHIGTNTPEFAPPRWEDRPLTLLKRGCANRVGLELLCGDKSTWKTMTQFEVRNNMAYASQIQFEVFDVHCGLQQAKPNVVFDWQFWERAALSAQDPKMTFYLHQGVTAKMCEITPFVNTMGTQYMAARAEVELACDSTCKQENP